ncbi:hypothetical protein LBMAG27_03960 [Bacteroidota bacterium]|nr:hypothetical protein LBMAG27_03960 [Bacteroidota bacterium]
MKKILLLVFVTLLAFNSFAQNNFNAHLSSPKQAPKLNLNNSTDGNQSGINLSIPNNQSIPHENQSRSGVTKIKFASSWNLNSVIVSESQSLTGDYDLNLISFTHRQCFSYPGISGLIQTSFSIDGGTTWDTSLVIQNDTTHYSRYPSGGIYNPAGNTNVNNAFSVISGPITSGSTASGGWIGSYFGSSQFNGTNNDLQFEINGQAGVYFQHMPRYSFTVTPQAKAFVMGADYNFNSTATIIPFNGMVLNTGSFNSLNNNFDWNRQHITTAYAHDPSDNSQWWSTFGSIAFNSDGSIGYIVQIGRDSVDDFLAPMPIIWKSTDGGSNWVKQPGFDFSGVTAIQPFLTPVVDGSTSRPYFTSKNGIDIAVDYLNNLHIVCQIISSYSSNPDSLGFIWSDSLNNGTVRSNMFDVYMDSSSGNGWNAFLIDSIQVEPVAASMSNWTSSTTGYGIDARIQMSMDQSREKMFYMWQETDFTVDINNYYPDIVGRSLDLVSHLPTYVKNFTTGTEYEGDNFWLYVGDKTFSDGGTGFNVPVTTTASADGSGNGEHSVLHYFLKGVNFAASDYGSDGVNSSVINENIKVSQNLPNPASDNTSFYLTLPVATIAKVEVTNILGQVIYSIPAKQYNSGLNTITIPCKKFTKGIYFYSVEINGEKITNKMIVE